MTDYQTVGAGQPIQFTFSGPFFGKGKECELILRALPDWFGIEEAILEYSVAIDGLPTWLVYHQDHLVGFLSIKQHNPYSAEVHVMGIKREWHRYKLGKTLLALAQEWLKGEGVEYLQVKTLGTAHPDENYARTRAFYEAQGFRPLEEFNKIWDEHNPCLIMVKRL
jgi:ribosomal protein S18 acetylase RimI-like enzyme